MRCLSKCICALLKKKILAKQHNILKRNYKHVKFFIQFSKFINDIPYPSMNLYQE